MPSISSTEKTSSLKVVWPVWYSQTKSAPGTVPIGLSLANTAAPVPVASSLTKVLPSGPAATEHDHKSTRASVVNTDRNCCN